MSSGENGVALYTQNYLNGTKIRKKFEDGGWYLGEVEGFDPEEGYYAIRYEDGDQEEFDDHDMVKWLYRDPTHTKKKKKPSEGKKRKMESTTKSTEKDTVNSIGALPSDSPENKPPTKKHKGVTLRDFFKISLQKSAKPTESQIQDCSKPSSGSLSRKPDNKQSSASDDLHKTTLKDTKEIESTRFFRPRKRVCYIFDEDDDHENDDGDDGDDSVDAPFNNTSLSAKKNNKKKADKLVVQRKDKKPKKKVDSDSDASFDEDVSDEDIAFDDDYDDIEAAPKKKKNAVIATARKVATKSTKTLRAKTTISGKKKMSESFEPTNFPVYKKLSLREIYKQKEFLDPCGMEATDGTVSRLVGEQVDKIGALLGRALNSKDGNLTYLGDAVKLGTACSGTDAPALALMLVKEQMEQRKMTPLNFTHEFSCEVDPFKQAYLARNFDSILYPDISKLADDQPVDVYGRPVKIPAFNMFVAGTSCKNFSMLRSKRRIDIEDRGCSGETFMAAVETLYKERPQFAIFENVEKAPWAKMSEYITGRVKLSECDSGKAIKEIKDKNKDLSFALDKNGDILVDYVPGVYGIRCGSVVDGFLSGDSTRLRTIEWPKTSKKACTLRELMRSNNISKANDTLVLKTPCTYCSKLCKVDTKMYGLPQTRSRCYLFVWQSDDGNVHDDLGDYWEAIVKYLQSPVRHALEGFILNDDHDIVRVLREALRGPPGRQTMRGIRQESDFWSSTSANLPHNKNTRAALGVEDRARFITQWGSFGKKQVPPSYWLEYMNCNFQRETDMIDILHASAARDAECHDSSFSSFFWNISQNVTKEKHRSAVPGIAGCITPGGDFFLPHGGRPMLGCEKLLLQGIPYFRLALGNETEVQLGDLAGNAMSLTVVCATMLAAIASPQLRQEIESSRTKDISKYLKNRCVSETYEETCIWEGETKGTNHSLDISESEIATFFKQLAELADEAIQASVWCTCETSGSMTTTTSFLECKTCRVSCCRNCISSIAGYNLETHETVDVDIDNGCHVGYEIQSKLRDILPSTLHFGKRGLEEIASLREDEARIKGLENFVFQLHRLKRDRKKWCVVYYARDNNGVGENMAELKICVGELERRAVGKDNEKGVMAEFTSFIPARTEPFVYGPLGPCAKLKMLSGNANEECRWMGLARDTTAIISIRGSGQTDSFRKEVGLSDRVAGDLVATAKKRHNAKDFNGAKSRGEVRRWLYAENWQTWPLCITIGGAPTLESRVHINGKYIRAKCRRTTAQSALWIREAGDDSVELYLLIRPNTSRTGPDVAIVSSSISHLDVSSVIAVFPRDWQPCDAFDPKNQKVKITLKHWRETPTMACLVPKSNLMVESPDSGDTLVAISGLSNSEVRMLTQSDDNLPRVKLNLTNGARAQQTMRVFNSVCVAQILKHMAQYGLRYDTSVGAEWLALSPSDSVPFGTCSKTIPPRPTESWFWHEERGVWDRSSEPGASRTYYLRLQEAPQPFEVWLDKELKTIEVKCFPKVVAHHAVSQLIGGRGDAGMAQEVSVSVRLSDIAKQSDPIVSPFRVSNCNGLQPTDVMLKAPYKLYDRQQKVVTKMLSIEERKTGFLELEMAEFEMPGSAGLSMMAKASRTRSICGGVIADAIGAGKTVISIALIVKNIKKARESRKLPNMSGATLVAVPPGLIDQWASEMAKFAEPLKLIRVYDCNSVMKQRVQEMINADVIIVNVDILTSKGYLDNLLRKAGLQKEVKDLPSLPTYSGQMEQIQARGVWIPHTSTDPYAGGNSPHNQRRRNVSAFYTYIYLKAISKLRQKSFSATTMGVPLEFFEYERIIVDEIHESLCTTKAEIDLAKSVGGDGPFYKEKNRRAARELLGITQKDVSKRPLTCRRAVFGLTGTPLLDSSNRVIELANLMGGTYVIGLSSHWRKLERESCRDIFLHNYLEPRQSREIRKNINTKCQDFLDTACTRNKAGEEMDGITLVEERCSVTMTEKEKELYLKSQNGIPSEKRSLSIKPDDFDPTAGHDISKLLRYNASCRSRGEKLVSICNEILANDPKTKIVVFTDGRIGAGDAARDHLVGSGLGCTWLDKEDSVELKNRKISWYQCGDATKEDSKRPRVLVLHFAHAAGLNLQRECYNLILFTPLYEGVGGSSGDPVSDASTELQAIGRVYRAGQSHPKVFVYRIEVQGPKGEECFDGQLIRRNTNSETIAMAVNSGE